MKRSKILCLGIAATLGVGALIGGVRGYLRNADIADAEKLDIYIEKPGPIISKGVDGLIDGIIVRHANTDFLKPGTAFVHPEHNRVKIRKYAGGEDRETLYTSTAGEMTVVESQMSKDAWKFKEVRFHGPNKQGITADLKCKIPWIIDAFESNKPYTVSAERDNGGRVKKLIYNLPDGRKVFLSDRNGNGIADKIN